MSAKKAAEALMQYDSDLRERVERLFEGRLHSLVPRNEKEEVIREAAGTWTLSLAAHAAGVTETQVLVALARYHLHVGTPMVAEGAVESALSRS